MDFLDRQGLDKFWEKIKANFISVKGGVVSGDITADGIISGSLIVNGASRFNGAVYATTFTGNLSGNASTATTATKLGTSTVGGTTTPIYLNNGVPTALSYTLGKSVPSDAKFTDHEYSTATSSVLGLVKSSTTGTMANRNYAVEVNSDGTMKVNVPWEKYIAATTEANGLMSSADKTKLNGIATGATAVSETTVTNWGFTKNAGTVTSVKVGTTSYSPTSGVVSLPAYPTKASWNYDDVYSKLGHTHDDRYYTESEIDTKLGNKLNSSLKGVASGLAELDANGKVPSTQLPSYVDDVIEGYLYNSKFYKEATHTTEITGESGKIYVDLATDKTYRWSGSAFAVISETLALGETSSTAYRGDRGKTAYDHSQATHARTDATKTEASSTNGKIKINGTDTTVYTHPSYTAYASGFYKVTVNASGHVSATTAVTKADITGLGIASTDVATQSANGLMSASDKVKLDGLPEVANLPYAMVSNGFVTTVKVGTTEYTTSNDGVISLPAYPTTLPASDVSAWAKATTKPSYSWSEIGSRPTKLSQFTDDLGSSPTHTHSQYLTSHQSLANYVTLNGAQTISGKKTFTGDIVVGSCTLHYDSTNACLQFNF